MIHTARLGARQAGFTLFEIMIVMAVLVTIMLIIIGTLFSAKRASNETAAITGLRQVHHGQVAFLNRDHDRDGRQAYSASIALLGSYDLIDETIAQGTKSGYVYEVLTAGLLRYEAIARPAEYKNTGDRYFYVDESGVIRAETGQQAGPTSQVVE